MQFWSFSTKNIEEPERRAAWVDILYRLKLPVKDGDTITESGGTVTIVNTQMGFEFALLEGLPQTYSGRTKDHDSAIWLAIILSGEGILDFNGESSSLSSQSIVFGASGVNCSLSMTTEYRMMFVRIPHLIISTRMITPIGQKVGVLKNDNGPAKMLNGIIKIFADNIKLFSDDQFPAVEYSLIEFLINCLALDGKIESKGGAAGARASHLRRICQKIETMLHDPDLNLGNVARENGVSTRYLQKLFATNNMTFSNYLKNRRLMRCSADLISPVHSQLSISEICFRWGFNDAAHFSRVFKEKFGVSPSAHRNKTNY